MALAVHLAESISGPIKPLFQPIIPPETKEIFFSKYVLTDYAFREIFFKDHHSSRMHEAVTKRKIATSNA